jgi:DNA-binding beta-propeller fold protein YncE
VTAITGFSAKTEFSGGHDDGVTSADEGRGWIFATDRTSGLLDIVDPRSRRIVSSVKLGGPPDYVRFVPTTGELWVTEPGKETIEIFRLSAASPPVAAHEAFLSVPGGPESLVVDGKRGRGYTHLWKGKTVAIDVKARAITATWENGCTGSRGIALDEPGRFLFAGCAEGKAVVLDAGNGKVISSLASGDGVDIIDFDPKLSHLYLPGGKSATMAVLGVSSEGQLSMLGTLLTAAGAHCVAAANGSVFVCDPTKGRLIVFTDKYPGSR